MLPEQAASVPWEEQVRKALAQKQTTMELSEALFGPNGVFAQVAGTLEEREQLLRHPLYQQAHSRLSDLRAVEVGRFESELARLEAHPARLSIQIPRSLHSALKAEAAREGVSLSELVRLKLSLPHGLPVRALASKTSASR